MVLVDTSVWIGYFHGDKESNPLEDLISKNEVCVNELILTELLPSMNHKKEYEIKNLILSLPKINMKIDWQNLIEMQTKNLSNGINKVGIPDLMIAQNSIQNKIKIFTLDKHFKLMSKIFDFEVYGE